VRNVVFTALRRQAMRCAAVAASLTGAVAVGAAAGQGVSAPISRINFLPAIESAAPGTVPLDAARGDFDLDGLEDIAVLLAPSQQGEPGVVQLFLASPTRPGAFVAGASLIVGDAASAIAVGDINQDQLPDLVVALALQPPDNVQTFLLAAPQQFVQGPSASAGAEPSDVALADFDSDQALDAVVVSLEPGQPQGSITVLFNRGDGVLAQPLQLGEQPALFTGFGASTSLLAGKRPKSVCPADVDQDGDPDLLVLNEGDPEAGEGGSLTSYANTGPQGLVSSRAVVFVRQPEVALGLGPAQEAVADMDRDGDLDVVVALAGSGAAPGALVLLQGQGGQIDAFSFAQPVALVDNVQALAVQAVDLDHDGDPDLPVIVGDVPNTGPQTQVYENLRRPGDEAVPTALAQTLTANQQPSLLLIADEDQDGDVDVLALGTEIVDQGAPPMQTVVATHPNASFHPADIDRSGSVGPGDLFLLLGNWGADCSLTPCAADVDGDGGVGPGDLFLLLGSWGFVTG